MALSAGAAIGNTTANIGIRVENRKGNNIPGVITGTDLPQFTRNQAINVIQAWDNGNVLYEWDPITSMWVILNQF